MNYYCIDKEQQSKINEFTSNIRQFRTDTCKEAKEILNSLDTDFVDHICFVAAPPYDEMLYVTRISNGQVIGYYEEYPKEYISIDIDKFNYDSLVEIVVSLNNIKEE